MSLTADKAAIIVRLPHLVRLHTHEIYPLNVWESLTANKHVTTAQLLGRIANPFPALRKLNTQMYATMMPYILPVNGPPTTPQVKVDRAQGLNVLLPLLKACSCCKHCSFNSVQA
jgi:hypothetical protein